MREYKGVSGRQPGESGEITGDFGVAGPEPQYFGEKYRKHVLPEQKRPILTCGTAADIQSSAFYRPELSVKSADIEKCRKMPDIDTSGSGSTVNTYKADLQRKKMIICEKNSYR